MADGKDTRGGRSEQDADRNCSEIVHELYVFLDGELTEEKRTVIQHHLDDCSPCLEAFDFHTELRMVVASRCRDEVPSSLRERILIALQVEGSDGGHAAEPRA